MKPCILISPYSKVLRNGKRNPKNYPWFPEIISGLKDYEIFQVGRGEEPVLIGTTPLFDLDIWDLSMHIKSCKTWISVDNFFQHLAWFVDKPGIVLWGPSDPQIFGHKLNTNLLKDKKYLRERQHDIWERQEYNEDAFVKPEVVLEILEKR